MDAREAGGHGRKANDSLNGYEANNAVKRALTKLAKRLLPARLRELMKQRVTWRYYRPPPIPAGSGVAEGEGGTLKASFGPLRLTVPAEARKDLAAIIGDRFGAQELALVVADAREGSCLLDVGAHRGLVGAFYCQAHPGARVVCFEPSPPLAAAERALAAANGLTGRMTFCQALVGSAVGKQKMLFDPEGGYVQVQRYAHTMQSEPREGEFAVETLDTFCAREGVRPTLIKIDVEGFEREVLRGATNVLREFRPRVLVELHLAFLAERDQSPSGVLEPLVAQGYRFTLLDGRPIEALSLSLCPLTRVHFLAVPKA
jgi:FkbM family methyltransferase